VKRTLSGREADAFRGVPAAGARASGFRLRG
jgi:hypothetical protein